MDDIKLKVWDKAEKRYLYTSVFDHNWYATPANDYTGCHCVKAKRTEDRHRMEIVGVEIINHSKKQSEV